MTRNRQPQSSSGPGPTRTPATVLVLTPFYLPAYKAGGLVRAVSNIVTALSGQFRFRIVCRDRDLRETHAFSNIVPGQWNFAGQIEIFYLPPGLRGLLSLYRLLRDSPFDAWYLNSFFSSVFSAFPLFLRRFNLTRNAPVLLAVRGDLHDGALSIKHKQKTIYRFVARALGLYEGVMFQVFGPLERKDLLGWFLGHRSGSSVFECADLVEIRTNRPERVKTPGELRIIFLSRIVRNKNLAYALEILQGVQGRVEFDIYGPREDAAYWTECESLIQSLPLNVTARYCGVVEPSNIPETFARYHLFLFPTAGESFGYVIQESICAACPVITSDRTPWQFEEGQGGWSIPLSMPSAFRSAIEEVARMDREQFSLLAARTDNLCDDLQRGTMEAKEKMGSIFRTLLQPQGSGGEPQA